MEQKKKSHFLLLLFNLLHMCKSEVCPKQNANLICYNDYSHNITCVWKSSSGSDLPGEKCTLHGQRTKGNFYTDSCTLQPFDASRPGLKTCSLILGPIFTFAIYDRILVTVSCLASNHSETILYKPACYIKLSPPEKPDVNINTVSWVPQVEEHDMISMYASQLEWKHQDQSWSDPSVQEQKKSSIHTWNFKENLDPDLLVQGETYEARVRVMVEEKGLEGTWSDWSPTESWVSQVGKIRQPSAGISVNILNVSVFGLAMFGLMLLVATIGTKKTTWVYMVRKMTNPPIPNPAKSAHFQNWSSPNFTSESIHSFLKPVEIVSVEVTSSVDAVTFCEPDMKTMPESISRESSGSSFSNPSYSELCSSSTKSSAAAGDLMPCSMDAPYKPVCGQGEEKNPEQGREGASEKDMEIMKLILNGSSDSKAVKMISEYEKVKDVQVERFRLRSVDSGMCSCEEVSQESMEVDSINMTDGQEEASPSEEKKKGGDGMKVDHLKLVGRSGGMLGRNTIQVCLDYKPFPKLQAGSPELPSLDSGISCREEERESQDDKPAHFLSPPHPSTQFNFPSPLLPALPCMFEKIPLMSDSMPLLLCDDGYKPVRQEQA
nr:uncharacterized protein LOC107375162 isoform X1 [Nothobranchius furzeri]XP_015799032.2 uncharacterized protein LOC107375162 isoform X1 [Nothobranchius furzeri]